MPDSHGAVPSVAQTFLKALLLAEKDSAPEIGVDHLFAALYSLTTESGPIEPSMASYVPIPYRDKAFSSQATAVIEAACAQPPCDLEQLTLDSLRTALVAAHDQTQ